MKFIIIDQKRNIYQVEDFERQENIITLSNSDANYEVQVEYATPERAKEVMEQVIEVVTAIAEYHILTEIEKTRRWYIKPKMVMVFPVE